MKDSDCHYDKLWYCMFKDHCKKEHYKQLWKHISCGQIEFSKNKHKIVVKSQILLVVKLNSGRKNIQQIAEGSKLPNILIFK